MAFNDKICIWTGTQWICTNSPIEYRTKARRVNVYPSPVLRSHAREVAAACSSVKARRAKKQLLAEVAAVILASPDTDENLARKSAGINKVMRLLLLPEVSWDDDFIVAAVKRR